MSESNGKKNGKWPNGKHPGGAPKQTLTQKLNNKNTKLESIKKLIQKGFTQKEVADFIGINEETFIEWKKAHPVEFARALKDWKDEADAKVERSLYESATGYKTSYKKNFVVSDGKDAGSHIETAIEEVVYPPSPTSCIFWLKNRKRKEWRDKIEVGGEILLTLSDEIRAARERIDTIDATPSIN